MASEVPESPTQEEVPESSVFEKEDQILQQTEKDQTPSGKDQTPSFPNLLALFITTLKKTDQDPKSRYKLDLLDKSTEKVFLSAKQYAPAYLKSKYQHSIGLQKLVDGGLDMVEKLTYEFSPKDKQSSIEKGFSAAKKFLGSLKKSEAKPHHEKVQGENVAQTATNPILSPTLHDALEIYQQMIKSWQETAKAGNTLDKPSTDSFFENMKQLYKDSPTIQKDIDASLNFAEKMASYFRSSTLLEPMKEGFFQARSLLKIWKEEAKQERINNPLKDPDPFQPPVRVEKFASLEEGGIEVVKEKRDIKVPVEEAKPREGSFAALREQIEREKKKM